MIDLKSFAVGMGVLAERFRSALAPPAQSGYYAILSNELTAEEFEIAVQLAFRHSRFWPSPQELVDFARPPRNLQFEATRAFEAVRKLGKHFPGTGMCWLRDDVTAVGPPALAGFDAIGANEGLRNLRPEYLSVVRKDFVEAYVAAEREERSVQQIEAARKRLAPRERPRIPGPVYETPDKPVSVGSVAAQILQRAVPPA